MGPAAHVVFKQGIRSSNLNEWCSRSCGYKQDILSTFMSELRLNSWHALSKLLRNRVNKLTRCWIFTIVVPEPEIRTPRGRSDLSAAPPIKLAYHFILIIRPIPSQKETCLNHSPSEMKWHLNNGCVFQTTLVVILD